MQVVDHRGHVGLKEHLVGTHRVASQEGFTFLGHETLDVRQDLLSRFLHGHSVSLEVLQQTGGGVHVTHKVVHVLQRACGRRDENIHAGVNDSEVAIGDDDGHLDEGVTLDVQAGHFAVDPDQGIFQSFHAHYVSALLVIRLAGSLGRWPLLHWKGIGRSFHVR